VYIVRNVRVLVGRCSSEEQLSFLRAAFFGLPTLLLEGYEATPCYDTAKWTSILASADVNAYKLWEDMCAWRRISDVGVKLGQNGTYAKALKVRGLHYVRHLGRALHEVEYPQGHPSVALSYSTF
jgi:hypothetical protein